jgi:putative ABC transport system ATP-binding protein
VQTALELVGLQDRMKSYPKQLSGGEEQRVAIARTIVNDPAVILADEPTGDLDTKSAQEILGLLTLLNQNMRKTIIMVTHDPNAAQHAHRTMYLHKGVFSQVQ